MYQINKTFQMYFNFLTSVINKNYTHRFMQLFLPCVYYYDLLLTLVFFALFTRDQIQNNERLLP
jgi:hypothetical protein